MEEAYISIKDIKYLGAIEVLEGKEKYYQLRYLARVDKIYDFAEEHHIIGAEIAETILLQENYPKEKIALIKKCILNHRGSRLVDKTTNEEICIADCDAMAHFYSIPSLLSMVYREKKLSIDEGSKFVMDKLDRSYNKMSIKGKKLVKKQYDSATYFLK